ncbi:hypothetical protein TRFO_02749 [Tritrichomonas foetus]|uniref:EF-hand domain-containing protein n=1 Tax=Tritrichomonas foetus TaxID=1144522 RepID=A0A1J4KYZ4_9EUKA|nr:hypothetical protein TRFO_02749 [Tritrichomonas foetus]|eukprot:OHT16471.1 hypothetical protein TRFO_02749 [Tritrichomonas foetus]
MLLLLLSLSSSFTINLRPIFATTWNVEMFDTNNDGKVDESHFYYFNLTATDDPDTYTADVFEGTFTETPEISTIQDDSPIDSFSIYYSGDDKGTIETKQGTVISSFKFEESFPYFLAAYGKSQYENFTFSVNIINLATIHISLFNFQNRKYREFVLTRFQPTIVKEPFYVRHNQIIVGGGVFILTFVLLHFIGPFLKKLGLTGTDRIARVDESLKREAEEKKLKENEENKEKEKQSKENQKKKGKKEKKE